MIPEKLQELTVFLLVENLYNENEDFSQYFDEKFDSTVFNKRYMKLLDEFLTEYALN